MKKLVLNISDLTYEKFMLEAILEQKSIQEIISERIIYKPFSDEIEIAFENGMSQELNKIFKD